MAELVTLEGSYNPRTDILLPPRGTRGRCVSRPSRRPFTPEVHYTPEEMGGLLDFGKDVFSAVTAPVVGVAKGTGHFVMEAGRGISRGDVGRVLASPFRGIGHMFGEVSRETADLAEQFYRPSKMREWMPVTGAALTAAGAIPSPLSPIFLAVGAGLTTAGAVGDKIYISEKAKKLAEAGRADEAARIEAEARRSRLLLWGVAAAGGLTSIYLMTR